MSRDEKKDIGVVKKNRYALKCCMVVHVCGRRESVRSKTTSVRFAGSTLRGTLTATSLILHYSKSTVMIPRVPPGRKTGKLVTAVDNTKVGNNAIGRSLAMRHFRSSR